MIGFLKQAEAGLAVVEIFRKGGFSDLRHRERRRAQLHLRHGHVVHQLVQPVPQPAAAAGRRQPRLTSDE